MYHGVDKYRKGLEPEPTARHNREHRNGFCKAKDCEHNTYRRGYCFKHYLELFKEGRKDVEK